MKVLVTGGRKYTDRDAVFRHLDAVAKAHFDANNGVPDEYGNWMPIESFKVAHGACNCGEDDQHIGADFYADEWCMVNWVIPEWYPVTKSEWRDIGRSAGPRRNERMLREFQPDLVLAFPGGPGTDHMKKIARRAGVEVREVS